MGSNTAHQFRVLEYVKTGQVKSDLIFIALADTTIEDKKMGFDRIGAPEFENRKRVLKKNEKFVLSVFNKNRPEIGSVVDQNYLLEEANDSFFDEISNFSGRPMRSSGFLGPWG